MSNLTTINEREEPRTQSEIPWNGHANPDETIPVKLAKIMRGTMSESWWKTQRKEWEKENEGKKGMKFSSGKPRWQLMAPLWPDMEQVVQVLTRGAEKYEDNNWMDVDRDEYIRAIMSHYTAYTSGERFDRDMGSPHLANLICSALFLLWHDRQEDTNDE